MKRGRFVILVALMAVMSLMVATTASTFAANKTQMPVLSFSKSGPAEVVYNASSIHYTISFSIYKPGAKDVVIEDNFLRGLDLASVTANFKRPNLPDVPITPVQTFAAVDRNTYTFALGNLDPGSYTLEYDALIIPGYYTARSALGKQVKDWATIYVGGKWKGKAASSANLVVR